MGTRRHGQGERALAPGKCCEVFCTLIVTYRQTLTRQKMYYSFTIFWRVGVVHLVVLAYVLRATTKKKIVNFFEEKMHSGENPGYAYQFVHPWKISCGSPC